MWLHFVQVSVQRLSFDMFFFLGGGVFDSPPLCGAMKSTGTARAMRTQKAADGFYHASNFTGAIKSYPVGHERVFAGRCNFACKK